MNHKPSLILYGAFDRYNYGDNLMPILIEKFYIDKYKDLQSQFNILYASIQESDLTRFSCKPTLPISRLLNVSENSVLMVVGGETMGAHVRNLYLHTFTNEKQHAYAKFLMKWVKPVYMYLAWKNYPSPWAFPYIPDKKAFLNNVKIVLNTVGGVPAEKVHPILQDMDYVSVRDERSYQGVKNVVETNLIPDSVLLISKLLPINELKKHLSPQLEHSFNFNQKYIVVQICPYKSPCSPAILAKQLLEIKNIAGIEPVLLPIGYASGHDDVIYLRQVQEESKNKLMLFYDLTVWDIAYFIASSKGFYGTSLHGVITALAYGVPHYCLNKNLHKLTSFLDTWSISPFNLPLDVTNIYRSLNCTYDVDLLNSKIYDAQKKIENHYDQIYAKCLNI